MESERCDACGLVLVSTNFCDDNGNTMYRCPQKCYDNYCDLNDSEEIPKKPPLHIDFVKMFENKNETRGYWFITWIYSPGWIEVWMKCHDGKWNCEAGWPKVLFAPLEEKFGEGPIEFIRKGWIRAKPAKAKELDEILFQHMRTNNIPYQRPYKYWQDNGELHPNDPDHPDYYTPDLDAKGAGDI